MPNHKLRFQCSKCLRSTGNVSVRDGYFVCHDCLPPGAVPDAPRIVVVEKI